MRNDQQYEDLEKRLDDLEAQLARSRMTDEDMAEMKEMISYRRSIRIVGKLAKTTLIWLTSFIAAWMLLKAQLADWFKDLTHHDPR